MSVSNVLVEISVSQPSAKMSMEVTSYTPTMEYYTDYPVSTVSPDVYFGETGVYYDPDGITGCYYCCYYF